VIKFHKIDDSEKLRKSIFNISFGVWTKHWRRAGNLALNKPASQISTASPASWAVDGDVNTMSCTERNSGRPWWAVDLGQRYYIGRVTITFPNNNDNDQRNDRRFCFIHKGVNSISGLWWKFILNYLFCVHTLEICRGWSGSSRPIEHWSLAPCGLRGRK